MISRTFEYTDFNGVNRKETHWFNLTKAEVIDMETSEYGGFAARLQRLSDSIDVPEMTAIFKDFIKRSYGVKSEDGRRFVKSEEVFEDFASTPMYSDLYMSLITDANEAVKFIKGIMPVMSKEQEKEFESKMKELTKNA